MKELILVRGIPGSGKSTFAKLLGGIHFEADMYFIDNFTQEYRFDIEKLKNAHRWCQNNVEDRMSFGRDRIVVSNTFTTEKELQPYYDLAKTYGYKVTSLIMENRHHSIDVHNVPKDKIDDMEKRLLNNIKLR
jgi:predicted kinase